LEFSSSEITDIGGALQEEEGLKRKFRRKLMALKMRSSGIPVKMIASSLDVSQRTVSNYTCEYRSGGLKATLEDSVEDRTYCPDSSVEPFWEGLEKDFRREPVGCAKQASVRIVKLTGITLSPSQTRRLMTKLGMSYRKAGQIPGKADGQLQLDFLCRIVNSCQAKSSRS